MEVLIAADTVDAMLAATDALLWGVDDTEEDCEERLLYVDRGVDDGG